MNLGERNIAFCHLAWATFGKGWVQYCAALQIADLGRLRAIQRLPGADPTPEEVGALLAAALAKRRDIDDAIRELQGEMP